jgi:hypothetical protein
MDDKYSTCGACTLRKKTKKTLPCVCRSAVFCSEECQTAGHAGCLGKRVGYSKHMSSVDELLGTLGNLSVNMDAAEKDMINKAMTKDPHMFPLLQQYGLLDFETMSARIDNGEGRGGDMYMLACRCGMRMDFSNTPPTPSSSSPPLPPSSSSALTAKSEHETNELACKYFRMAAADGFLLASLFLAGRLLSKGGSTRYCTEAEDLLEDCWRANMPQAYDMLADRSRIAKEMQATSFTFAPQNLDQFPPGQSIALEGPNAAAAILSTVAPTLFKSQFSRPHDKQPLICRASGVQLMVAARRAEARGFTPIYCYGRAGTECKEVQRMTLGAKLDGPRVRTMPMFRVGSPQAVPDTVSDEDIAGWQMRLMMQPSPVRVSCAHLGRPAGLGQERMACPECLGEATVRLSAVASGNYALSQHEEHDELGLTALFLKDSADAQKVATATAAAGKAEGKGKEGEGGAETPSDDVLTSLQRRETFRAYSRVDVNTYLYCLSLEQSGPLPLYSHPLFLAMDANLFWPVIFHYGSLRAGLQAAAPQLPWSRLLPKGTKVTGTKGTKVKGGKGSSSSGAEASSSSGGSGGSGSSSSGSGAAGSSSSGGSGSSGSSSSGSGAYGVFGGLVKKCGHEECMRLEIGVHGTGTETETDSADKSGKESSDSNSSSSRSSSSSSSSSKSKGKKGFSRCSLCVARVYCCAEHQKSDW